MTESNIHDQKKTFKSWPFKEAYLIIEDVKKNNKKTINIGSGYSPSGFPHIGTFGEIVRVGFIATAILELSKELEVNINIISDDYDGLRKVPDNIKNKELYYKYIGYPVSKIPSSYDENKSFAQYMNDKMISFMNIFNLNYNFISSYQYYISGKFNQGLHLVAKNYDKLKNIMLESLGEERKKTYSPFMPIDPDTGKILQSGVKSINPDENNITFLKENGEEITQKFTDGNTKLQWKCDFAMRWGALDIDYEIYGKDHNENDALYKKLSQIINNKHPRTYFYEAFLDEEGRKISKSKGNGVSLDQWLKYAPEDSLAYFMFIKPRVAKKMTLSIIPKVVDEYLAHVKAFSKSKGTNLDSPVFFISKVLKNIEYDKIEHEISYSILLNITSVCDAENEDVLWEFIKRYDDKINKDSCPYLAKLVDMAILYNHDIIKLTKKYKKIEGENARILNYLKNQLKKINSEIGANDIQNLIHEYSQALNVSSKDIFNTVYNCILGSESGPRVGTFIKIYGIDNFIKRIESLMKI